MKKATLAQLSTRLTSDQIVGRGQMAKLKGGQAAGDPPPWPDNLGDPPPWPDN